MSQEIIKLAVDTYKGTLVDKYSKNDSLKVLREAFVEMNGGSTKLDFKKMRYANGRPEMFAILEEILQKTIVEGIQNDNYFENFVEYRNLALGDQNSFTVQDSSLFTVAEIAEGTTNIRRQRLNAGTTTSIATKLNAVKIYEELNRVLAGRVDFNEMVNTVGKSFKNKIASAIYTSFAGSFSSLPSPFAYSGAYSEDTLVDLVQHVEAATGMEVTIVGTKNALRKITTAVVSEAAKQTYNEMGYYGNFNGTPMMMLKQAHTPGTYNFMLSDKDIYVVPTNTKPVKFVTEGESLILMGDPMQNADLTQEYLFADRYGLGIIIATLFGIYRLP